MYQEHKKKLYSTSYDGTLKVWDATNMRENEDDIYSQENGIK